MQALIFALKNVEWLFCSSNVSLFLFLGRSLNSPNQCGGTPSRLCKTRYFQLNVARAYHFMNSIPDITRLHQCMALVSRPDNRWLSCRNFPIYCSKSSSRFASESIHFIVRNSVWNSYCFFKTDHQSAIWWEVIVFKPTFHICFWSFLWDRWRWLGRTTFSSKAVSESDWNILELVILKKSSTGCVCKPKASRYGGHNTSPHVVDILP